MVERSCLHLVPPPEHEGKASFSLLRSDILASQQLCAVIALHCKTEDIHAYVHAEKITTIFGKRRSRSVLELLNCLINNRKIKC